MRLVFSQISRQETLTIERKQRRHPDMHILRDRGAKCVQLDAEQFDCQYTNFFSDHIDGPSNQYFHA
jgi:hypothetical protein